MERRKRWQFFLILSVLILTIYNILPTLFYYSKPLRKPIGEKEASQISKKIATRVNSLEDFTLNWLTAQSKNLGLKPVDLHIDSTDPNIAQITFKTEKEAAKFSNILEKAGAIIPFVPAQLSPIPSDIDQNLKTAEIQRKIGYHFDEENLSQVFTFIPKRGPDGEITSEYRSLIDARAAEIAVGLGGASPAAKTLLSLSSPTPGQEESLLRLAYSIVEYDTAFGENDPLTKRYYASFTQMPPHNLSKVDLMTTFVSRLEQMAEEWGRKIASLEEEQKNGKFLSDEKQQRLEVYKSQRATLSNAVVIIRRNITTFTSGADPITFNQVLSTFSKDQRQKVETISIGEKNPFVQTLTIDWEKETIEIQLHSDVAALRENALKSEAGAIRLEKLNALLFNEIARVARKTDETITPSAATFTVKLSQLDKSTGVLVLDFVPIAKQELSNLKKYLNKYWQPQGSEFNREDYPIVDAATYETLSPAEQKFALVLYAPITDNVPREGFRPNSIYVIAKGMETINKRFEGTENNEARKQFESDFHSLYTLLRQNNYIGYRGALANLPSEYQNDYIFELSDYHSYLIAATREDFLVKGDKRKAVLELSDVESRLLIQNKIDTRIHEDLVKWKDLYQSSRVNLNTSERLNVPKPTQNILLNNLKLSLVKYFRGDNRKILKWGLDLSGGKTVRIGLKDQNGKPITNEDDLKQASNELYARVNKLGVSEVGIRREGSSIVLDFPGSQGLSASDLIEASAMYFHVVNEKFTPTNPTLADAVNAFLEEVWNEAVITNRTDADSLNEIAFFHLGGDPDHEGEFYPLSSHAKLLFENGLRLAGPKASSRSSSFDDTLSAIAPFRGKDYQEWQGQTHPLVIVFRNYVLEGANLTEIQTGYDPSEGNTLYFAVKGSQVTREGEKINPRNDFFTWTSQFSEEKIVGTPQEAYTGGRGWRMAVVLNGSIISAPTLHSPLRDRARITGHFSQREINQLAADLKAGSLSFTPHILSEQNISPDLGKEQRFQGIFAAGMGLLAVIAVMCIYYRFGGVVASFAVMFNLLVLWAVLQNLGAALTLPGIAGIILTVGMAVDANVLVFERIREEFAISNRLPSAIQAGYRKAFSAILDSNLTTIIAALILLNFDSGPIKGFALTLIIGIVSSFFTSLFVTRYFFAGWVQNPKHKALNMMRFFQKTSFDFLKHRKAAIIGSIAVLLAGGFFLFMQRETIFGMDFTGGYAIQIELEGKPGVEDYRLAVAGALEKGGAAANDFQIRELNSPTQLRVQLSRGMERTGKPFHDIDKVTLPSSPLFSYQENPRIVWIVTQLENEGLKLTPTSLMTLNQNWNEMSGQMSDSMRNQALIGLGLALFFLLIYITFRFEFKYAISAILGLAHDLLITLGIIALMHLFWEGIQIDLQVIAAFMTIIGYSLNDTIIVFDRIREDVRLLRKLSFYDIINHALNATLSRTVMTSMTTLVAVLALLFLGGPSIFNFSLVMTLGIVIGTFSSLFIASPLLLYFHNKEAEREVKKLPSN